MKRACLILALLFLAGIASAQTQKPYPGVDLPNVWTAPNTFMELIGTPTTVGALGAASASPYAIRWVSDSTTVAVQGQSCVGGGTQKALAFSNGTVWACFSSSSGGANQAVSFTNQTSVSFTAQYGTPNVVPFCWDGQSPVSHGFYPNDVSINIFTFLMTFTFSAPQSGFCVINGNGGGGGGGGGGVGGSIVNYVLQATGPTTSAFVAPELLTLGNGGTAVTTCPYPVAADSPTTTLDRGKVVELNSASSCSVTLNDPPATGMGNGFYVRFRNVGAGIVTVNRQTAATFSVATGSSTGSGVGGTSFSMSQWQWADCYADAANWRCDEVTGGSGSGFPITTAVAINSGGSITVNTGGSIGVAGSGTIAATSSTTAANLAGCVPSAAGDLCLWSGSAWARFAGNNSGSKFFQEDGSGNGSWVAPTASGVVNNGTTGQFTWYASSGNTVSGNAHLDDSATSALTITSSETLAAPRLVGTGSGATAIGFAQGADNCAGGAAIQAAPPLNAAASYCEGTPTQIGDGTTASSYHSLIPSTPATGFRFWNYSAPTAVESIVAAIGTGSVVQASGLTGTGSAVLATSPTLVTPNLGTPSALTLTNALGLPCAAMPPLTGDTTSAAGSCATTTVDVNGGAIPASAVILGSNSGRQIIAATVTGSGTTAVLATSPVLTTPSVTTINDANGNPFVASTATASAVDSVTVGNAAAANPATVTVSATGTDANININLVSKGTGVVQCNGSTCGGGASFPLTAPTGGGAYGTSTPPYTFTSHTGDGMIWGATAGISHPTLTASGYTTAWWENSAGTGRFFLPYNTSSCFGWSYLTTDAIQLSFCEDASVPGQVNLGTTTAEGDAGTMSLTSIFRHALTGTNTQGADITVGGGNNTGTHGTGVTNGGRIFNDGPNVGAAGTSANTLVHRQVINENMNLSTTSATATAIMSLNVAADSEAGALIRYSVIAKDTTGHQNCISSGRVTAVAENSASTVKAGVDNSAGVGTSVCTGSDTITLSFTITNANPAVLSVTPSWTTIVPTAVYIIFSYDDLSDASITP